MSCVATDTFRCLKLSLLFVRRFWSHLFAHTQNIFLYRTIVSLYSHIHSLTASFFFSHPPSPFWIQIKWPIKLVNVISVGCYLVLQLDHICSVSFCAQIEERKNKVTRKFTCYNWLNGSRLIAHIHVMNIQQTLHIVVSHDKTKTHSNISILRFGLQRVI